MKIIVDAFGGDNAPLEILKGACEARDELSAEVILCGSEQKIEQCAAENGIDLNRIAIINATDVITMHDDPAGILKEHRNSSMAVGLSALAEGKGDAFVSAGSTGALVMGSTFLVKRIKGIRRASLATVLPGKDSPAMLIDSGANVECKPEMLVQFAVMGSAYMSKVQGVDKPRVALLNVGTEETKGDELRREAYALLKRSGLNFVGNIEARDVPESVCDVIVADGFSGNVLLKSIEGISGYLMSGIKEVMMKNVATKLGAMAMKNGLRSFKAKMDYTEYGGAPLMGIAKPVIKAHGSSNAKAVKNAIRQAQSFAGGGAIAEIEEYVAAAKAASAVEVQEL